MAGAGLLTDRNIVPTHLCSLALPAIRGSGLSPGWQCTAPGHRVCVCACVCEESKHSLKFCSIWHSFGFHFALGRRPRPPSAPAGSQLTQMKPLKPCLAEDTVEPFKWHRAKVLALLCIFITIVLVHILYMYIYVGCICFCCMPAAVLPLFQLIFYIALNFH